MSNTFKCDHCQMEAPAMMVTNKKGQAAYVKPDGWYQRGDKTGIEDACSIKCAKAISEATKTDSTVISSTLILP